MKYTSTKQTCLITVTNARAHARTHTLSLYIQRISQHNYKAAIRQLGFDESMLILLAAVWSASIPANRECARVYTALGCSRNLSRVLAGGIVYRFYKILRERPSTNPVRINQSTETLH